MGFICHVEHPHKFISNYLATLESPPKLTQEAWILGNDRSSLRTTLCVQFKSEVVACGVVYAVARRFHVPLPENPPWWKAFDADKSGIEEVCRALAYLYSLPKAQYIPVCKDGEFTFSSNKWNSQSHPVSKEVPKSSPSTITDTSNSKATTAASNPESSESKGVSKAAIDKVKDSKESDDESKSMPIDLEGREDLNTRSKAERSKSRDRDKDKDRERERDRDRIKGRDRERGDREEAERDRTKDRGHRSNDRAKDSGGIQINQDITHHEIVTTTVPRIPQGRRIAIDITLIPEYIYLGFS